MVTQKNNFHEFETYNIFLWIFKAYVAIYLVTNTFNITMAVFDVGQHVVNNAAGVISGNTAVDASEAITRIVDALEDMELGDLFLLSMETLLISITMRILSIIITVILYGRMIAVSYTHLDVNKRQVDWLHCIAAHRKKKMFIEVEREMARYDIIAGKIADDATNATLTAYLAGAFGTAGDKEADDFCIRQLLPNKLKDQYCFKTEAAIECLKFVKGEKIWLK